MNSLKVQHFLETCMEPGNLLLIQNQAFCSKNIIILHFLNSKKAVEDVQKDNKICILDIDTQGVKSIRHTSLNPVFIFMKPPNMEILEARLRARNTESEESLQKRLQTAKSEMEYGKSKT